MHTQALVRDARFQSGDTTTRFLEKFKFEPRIVEVVAPGVHCCANA